MHPVGQKRPNEFGLFDMHGNVWEWCADGRRAYQAQPELDPVGELGGARRVIRGGSWDFDAGRARSAYRFGDQPGLRWLNLGFRLALRSQSPAPGGPGDPEFGTPGGRAAAGGGPAPMAEPSRPTRFFDAIRRPGKRGKKR